MEKEPASELIKEMQMRLIVSTLDSALEIADAASTVEQVRASLRQLRNAMAAPR